MAGQRVTIGTAVLELTTDNAGVVSGLKLVDAEFDKAGQSWTKRLSGLGSVATSLGKTMSVGLTAPLVAIGALALKLGTDFNKAMANVASLMPGSTKRVEELKASVQDLAVETGKSTDDLAGGLYQVVSAFGDTADTAKILEINAKAAAAGVAETTDAINLTSAVTKGYGDTSAAAVQQVSDLALQTVKLGQTTFPELAGSIGKVVPLAQQLNVTQQELFGTMATFTGVTGTASEVSTQLRGVLQSLLAPTEEMSNLFGKLGVSSGQALIQQRGLQGAIDAIVKGAKDAGVPLQKLIGSVEGQTIAMSAATAQHQALTEKIAAMKNVVGVTDAAFKEQTQGINKAGFSWEQLKQKLVIVEQRLSDGLGPAVTVVTSTIGRLIPYLDQAVKWFTALPPGVQATALGLVGLAAAAGPVLMFLGSAISAAGKVSTAMSGVTTAINLAKTAAVGFITTPLGAALLGIGIAAIALKAELDRSTAAQREHIKAQDDANKVYAAAKIVYGEQQARLIANSKLTDEQKQKLFDLAASGKKVITEFDGLSVSLDVAKAGLAKTTAATNQAADAAGYHATLTKEERAALDKLGDTYSKGGLQKKVKELTDAFYEAGKRGGFSAEGWKQFSKELLEAGRNGGQLPPVFQDIYRYLEEVDLSERATSDSTRVLSKDLAALTKAALGTVPGWDGAVGGIAEMRKQLAGLNLQTGTKLTPPPAPPKGSLDEWKKWGQDLSRIGSTAMTGLTDSLVGLSGRTHEEHKRQADDAVKNFDRVQAETNDALGKAQRTAREKYDETARSAKESFERTKRDAIERFEAMKASGDYTTDELQAFWNQMNEELEQSSKDTDKQIADANALMLQDIDQAEKEANDALVAAHQEMLDAKELASHRWKDNLKDIWGQVLINFQTFVSDMATDFIERGLKGMLGALTGQEDAWAMAFKGVFGRGAKKGVDEVTNTVNAAAGPGGAWLTAFGAAGAIAGVAFGAYFILKGRSALGEFIDETLAMLSTITPEMLRAFRERRQETAPVPDADRSNPNPGNGNPTDDNTPGDMGDSGGNNGVGEQGFAKGTPRLDFRAFRRLGQRVMVHAQEAIIPRGGGHRLAGEIASSLAPMVRPSGDLQVIEANLMVNQDVFGKLSVRLGSRHIKKDAADRVELRTVMAT